MVSDDAKQASDKDDETDSSIPSDDSGCEEVEGGSDEEEEKAKQELEAIELSDFRGQVWDTIIVWKLTLPTKL